MAPLINPFKLIGKTAARSPFDAEKSKGKGKSKGVGQGKKGRKPIYHVIAPKQSTPSTDSSLAAHEPQQQLPVNHEIEEFDHGRILSQRKREGDLKS